MSGIAKCRLAAGDVSDSVSVAANVSGTSNADTLSFIIGLSSASLSEVLLSTVVVHGMQEVASKVLPSTAAAFMTAVSMAAASNVLVP